MQIALDDLELDALDVIHAGQHTFPLTERIRAVTISDVTSALRRSAESPDSSRGDEPAVDIPADPARAQAP